MRRRLTRLLAAAALVPLIMLGGAACGIPDEGNATLAKPEDVPFELLEPPSETSSTTAPGSGTEAAKIFLVQGEHLATAVRAVPAPKTPESVLEVLLQGPNETEVALGLRTALLGQDVAFVRSIGVSGGIATVDLGPSFGELSLADEILALAQLVSTFTDLPGIGRVSFTKEGNPTGIPKGDGAFTTESVSRDDYSVVAPLPLG
jgi:hypothetical protein